jgi:polyhydroxyalkanoate synthase
VTTSPLVGVDGVDHGDVAVPLDSLLTDAARRRPLPGREIAAWAISLAQQPRSSAGRLAELTRELGAIVAGQSDLKPSTRDRRYADKAWSDNPFLRRLVQGHLALTEKAAQLLGDADLDERSRQRLQLLVDNVSDAFAPSNSLLNPEALKETIDTGGANLVRGARNLASDLARAPRVPSMVDTSGFGLGENLALSEGAVIHRTPVFELIQYRPTTETVREVPLLIVPPTINKYYVLDLAPGRSVVEYLVSQGQQVFVLSWRNPTARHAEWGIDTYVHAVVEANEVVQQVTGSDRSALWGTCSGGIITTLALAYLSAVGRGDEVSSLTLPVTVLDQARAGTASALLDRGRADLAIARSRRQGYLDGASLAEMFAWLRPNDLVWNYWVNNYLLGRKPPAFDILYWNADTTRMPAGLHRDFLELSLGNKLVTAGDAVVLGIPVDLGRITADAYLIGGVADHITPWQSCYRTTRLLGGKTEFVLSNSGHVAALVNPPSNAKASFQHSADCPPRARDFQATAESHRGSWWEHYAPWLASRTGDLVPAPAELGGGGFAPLAPAPGTYVFDT